MKIYLKLFWAKSNELNTNSLFSLSTRVKLFSPSDWLYLENAWYAIGKFIVIFIGYFVYIFAFVWESEYDFNLFCELISLFERDSEGENENLK